MTTDTEGIRIKRRDRPGYYIYGLRYPLAAGYPRLTDEQETILDLAAERDRLYWVVAAARRLIRPFPEGKISMFGEDVILLREALAQLDAEQK